MEALTEKYNNQNFKTQWVGSTGFKSEEKESMNKKNNRNEPNNREGNEQSQRSRGEVLGVSAGQCLFTTLIGRISVF